MPRIIAFTSSKGGCGATFVCAALWQALLQKDKRVIAVDMCFEGCSLDYALSFQNDYVYTLSDVLGGNARLDEAMCGEGGTFIRCDYESEGFCYEEAFDVIKNIECDYVLIDFDGANKETLQSVIEHADELIVVTEPSPIAVKHSEKFCTMCGFENTRIVINKIIPYLIRDGVHLTVDEVLDSLGYPLLGLLQWDYAAEIIFKDGVSGLKEFEKINSCFLNMADRICGQAVPANDIEAFFKDARIHRYLTKGRN